MIDRELLERIRAEQRERWERGDRVPVEAYLEQNHSLVVDHEGLLDLIYNEVVLREEASDPPRLEEYTRRFPQLQAELRLQFEVHHALESLQSSEGGIDLVPAMDDVAIPGYEILEELGRGGMGVVYRARQLALKRQVALKMILTGVHAGPNELLRFRTEAEAVARLQHPQIVQIHEVLEDGAGRPCLCIELMEGGSLADSLAGAPQPARESAELVRSLATAIEHIHRHGIIHRDLKPSNVLFTAEGVAKVTDFGLAKLLDADSGQTPSEAFLGTPSYMAPEQAAGRAREIGPPSDVYALGAILYEMLTGRPPFRAETPMDTLLLVVSQEPVPPKRLRPNVPRDLNTICLKCLEKEPRLRYASAGALADDLGRFLAGEPIRGRPSSPWQRAVKWARRRPAAASLLGVTVAAVLAAALLGWRHDRLERRRLGLLRAEATQHMLQARVAFSGRDWEGAQLQLAQVVARIDGEPALAGLEAEARQWLAATRQQLDEQSQRRQTEARLRTFERWRDEALFQGARPVDRDAAARLRATEAAVREALAAVGIGLTAHHGETPALDAHLAARERAEVLAGCYELLLVLADAQAQRLPGEAPDDHRRRVHGALETLDRAAAFGPPTRAYHLRRARDLAVVGDRSSAELERARAEALPPAGAIDEFLLGIDSFVVGDDERPSRGDLAAAIGHFDRALRLQPGHFWARYYLAACQLIAGRPELAEAHLGACLGQRPDAVWVYLSRGFARGKLRDFPGALADFARAWALGPDDEARYALLVNRGSVRLEQGQLAEAAADLEKAAALKPDGFRAHANLALVAKARGRIAEARNELDRAIALCPPGPALADLQAERTHLLLLGHEYRAAVDACDALLESRPDDRELHAVRARALLALGDHAGADRAFGKYLELGGSPTADIYRGRGQARMKRGDYPGAVDDYTRALHLQARPDWEILAHRGWAYVFAEAPRLALPDFDEAIRLNPADTDAYAGRGLARVALGLDREAVADAERALAGNVRSAEMLHNIGCIFAQAAGRAGGDQAEAYRRLAVEAIGRSLDRVPAAERSAFWRDKVVPDRYLDPIRHSPEFLNLTARMAAATASPGR